LILLVHIIVISGDGTFKKDYIINT